MATAIGKTPVYTAEMIRKAIPGTRGVQVKIAERLGCSRATVAAIIKRCPELLDDIQNEKEIIKDLVEDNYLEKVVEGNDWRRQKHFMRTQMRDRGYGERRERSGAAVVNIQLGWGDSAGPERLEGDQAYQIIDVEPLALPDAD